MTPSTLLITGASGNVDGALLPLLADHSTKLLAASSQDDAVVGVPGRAVDFTRPDTLTQSFAGVDVAFIAIPLHPTMVEMAQHVAQAARRSALLASHTGIHNWL